MKYITWDYKDHADLPHYHLFEVDCPDGVEFDAITVASPETQEMTEAVTKMVAAIEAAIDLSVSTKETL